MEKQSESPTSIKLIRGPLNSLSVYDITDYELDILEEGSPNSLFLNFAVFFASIATSFFITLVTVDISSIPVFTVFVVLTVVGSAAAFVLFALWRETRSRVSELIQRIRDEAITAKKNENVTDAVLAASDSETESQN